MYLPRNFGYICEVLLLDSEPGHEYQILFIGYYTKKDELAPWFTWMPIPWVEIKGLMTDDILDKVDARKAIGDGKQKTKP